MTWKPPPIVEFIRTILKSWQFWTLLILFSAFGFFLQQRDQDHVACELYASIAQTGVESTIDRVFGNFGSGSAGSPATTAATSTPVDKPATTRATTKPSTQPTSLPWLLKRTIHDYFCVRTEPPEGWVPSLSQCVVVVPGAFAIAMLIVGLLPLPSKPADVTDRVNQALADAPAARSMFAKAPDTMSAAYVQNALATRQLRIALIYAAVSGLVTILVPPAFRTSYSLNLVDGGGGWHAVAILLAAAAAVVYGVQAFISSRLSTWLIAWRLGWGPIFFAGVVALAMSLPYQALRPVELSPLARQTVLMIIAVRLFVLPAFAFGVVVLLRLIQK